MGNKENPLTPKTDFIDKLKKLSFKLNQLFVLKPVREYSLPNSEDFISLDKIVFEKKSIIQTTDRQTDTQKNPGRMFISFALRARNDVAK